MAITVAQVAHFAPPSGPATTVTATLPVATTAGNLLVAIVSGFDATPVATSMSDSRGNTWTLDYATAGGVAAMWFASYSAPITAAGTPHTVTFTQANITIANVDVAELAGAITGAGRFEAAVLGGATGVSPYTAGPTGTLTQADEIAFAALGIDTGETSQTLTQDATWVLIGEQQDGTGFVGSVVYKVVAATTPVSHVWTGTYGSALWASVILSYKAGAVTPTGAVAAVETADTSAIVASTTAPSGGVVAVVETPDTSAIVATFTGAPAVFRYPVARSGRKFIDQTGAVILFNDVSSWGMIQNLSNANITLALTGVAARHFSGPIAGLCGVRSTSAGWSPFVNAAGQGFFTGTPYQTGLGPAWSSTDHYVSECTRLGLVAGLTLWISQDNDGPRAEIEAASNAQMQTFGASVASRYASTPSILWTVMADNGWAAESTIGQRIDAFFQGVRSVEGATPRLIVAEPYFGGTSYQMFISQQLDHGHGGGYQYLKLDATSPYNNGDPNAVEFFDAGYNESGATSYPVWDCEPGYVGANHYSGTLSVERQNIRERNYATLIRGGVGSNWGDEAWWTFDKPGLFFPAWTWQDVMTNTEAFQAQYCYDLVNVYCADATWVPDNTSLTVGLGSGDTKAAVGHSDTALLVYVPTNRSVTVDTTVIAGTGNVRLRWYDPTAGTFATISTSEAQSASRAVSYPGNHTDGSSDYVLVVDDTAAVTAVTGIIASVEPTDTPAIAGTVAAPLNVFGTIVAVEVADGRAIVGTVTSGPITGVLAVVEANDSSIIVGFIPGAPTTPSGPLVVTVQAWPAPLVVEITQP